MVIKWLPFLTPIQCCQDTDKLRPDSVPLPPQQCYHNSHPVIPIRDGVYVMLTNLLANKQRLGATLLDDPRVAAAVLTASFGRFAAMILPLPNTRRRPIDSRLRPLHSPSLLLLLLTHRDTDKS